jgi:hypothetical protein
VALTPNAPGGSGLRPECHFIRDGADAPKRASAFLEGNAPSLPLRNIACHCVRQACGNDSASPFSRVPRGLPRGVIIAALNFPARHLRPFSGPFPAIEQTNIPRPSQSLSKRCKCPAMPKKTCNPPEDGKGYVTCRSIGE